jgi:tetratricopeptide (TPR) repeat protein
LRSIYAQQGSIEKYVAVAERTGLTLGDCTAIARILEAKRKLNDALGWIERGIAMQDTRTFYSDGGHDLAGMRRALLKKLRRGQEALDSAWTEFEKYPGTSAYEELMRYVPKPDRAAWHEKAMSTAERGNLEPFIELCVKAKGIDRLAKRLHRAGDRELEELSHYVNEPAATALAKTHPAVAAKVFRALGMRVLKAAKSKYYDAALAHLEEARRCYLAAGLEQQWEALALEIRRDHSRKSSFMPGFNAIIAGKRARVEPSFLDQARWRWASKAKA